MTPREQACYAATRMGMGMCMCMCMCSTCCVHGAYAWCAHVQLLFAAKYMAPGGKKLDALLGALPLYEEAAGAMRLLDADAFLVLQIGVSSKGGRRLNQSPAIERLLGPRVRSAVHGTAQDLQPAGLANRLEQVAEPLLRRTPKPHTPFPPLTSSAPLPLPPAGSRRTARARLC